MVGHYLLQTGITMNMLTKTHLDGTLLTVLLKAECLQRNTVSGCSS